MTVLATATNPRFSVSRVDIDRRGSRTPSTRCANCARSGRRRSSFHHRCRRAGPDPGLAFGADELFYDGALCRSFPAGYELSLDDRFPGGLGQPGGDSGAHDLLVGLPGAGRRGTPIWYLVPDPVVRYIDKRHLYRDEV